MARRLAEAGLLVGVCNRTAAKADEVAEELGVAAFATPAALAAACDVVVTILADEPAVREVVEALASALAPGAVVVEMSTIGPGPLPELSDLLAARGCSLVDAPVSGSVALAASGELTAMVGGDDADVARVRPVLEALTSRVFELGSLGAGATTKLAVNTVIYALNEAVAEALVLAERAGLDRSRVYDVFAASAIAAPFVHYRRQAFEAPETVPVALRLVLAAKDLRLALELAAAVGHTMPQAELDLAVVEAAAAAGYGDDDVSAVAEFLRRERVTPSACNRLQAVGSVGCDGRRDDGSVGDRWDG